MELDLSKIIFYPLPPGQFFPDKFPKQQIVLHHTAGADSGKGVYDWFKMDNQIVGVCCAIEMSGQIVQGFSSSAWAYHLGIDSLVMQKYKIANWERMICERQSIAIEICSWGALSKKNGKFYSWAKVEVPANDVYTYETPFRGSLYFQKYSKAQIESTRQLLVYWGERYKIPLTYNADMWDVNVKALKGVAGVWAHVSYLPGKSDVHPQHDMVEMLKSL